MAKTFAAQHRWDRAFHLAFVAVAWGAVYLGFASDIAKRFRGQADYAAPAILVLHVATVFGWMVLLTAQMLLIRYRGHRLHQRLGMALIVLAPAMVVSAIGAEVVSQRFYSPNHLDNLLFFGHPLFGMIGFASLAGGAWRWRRDPATHKRLIYAATCILLNAASFRWLGDTVLEPLGDGFAARWAANYLVVDVLVAAGLLYDLATRGSVHRGWAIALPVVLASEGIAVALSYSAAWGEAVRWIVGL